MFSKLTSFFTSEKTSKPSSKETETVCIVGRLFKKKIGLSHKELSDDVELRLKVKDESAFSYFLVAKNNNYEFDKTEWDILEFQITNNLALKSVYQQGLQLLVWEANSLFFVFYILNDSNNTTNKLPFLYNLCNLVYSYEIEVPIKEVDTTESITYLSNLGEIQNLYDFLDERFGEEVSNPPQDQVIKDPISLLTKDINKLAIENKRQFSAAPSIFIRTGTIMKFDKANDKLSIISKRAIFKIVKPTDYKYYLLVDDYQNVPDGSAGTDDIVTVTSNLISQELLLQGNHEQNYVIWIGKNDQEISAAYNFIFDEKDSIEELNKVINRCWFELNNRVQAKSDDEEWLNNCNAMDVDDINDEDDEVEEIHEFNETKDKNQYSNFDNRLTTQSYLNNRTFIVKDNNAIVIYKANENNELDFLDSIEPIKTYENSQIKIGDAKMFASDSSILLLDRSKENDQGTDKIYKYDLNKLKIVEEYQANKNIKDISSFTNPEKYGNMTDNPLIVGVNQDNLFTLDTRLNSNYKAASVREYAKSTHTMFKCLATTRDGSIIVGSVDGKIRLYKNNIHSKTSAVTCLPGFGDPIKSVDVSNDGLYLLVTCNNYLLVIDTKVKVKEDEIDGFKNSITKHAKSLKLQISPLDIDKFDLYNCGFTPAKFNVGDKICDTNIITSLGEYIVSWNFAKVKKGNKSDYKIKKMSQLVKNNEFIYNKAEMIVTMNKNVGLQHQFK